MLAALFSRLFGAAESPAADLYFRNACADFVGSGVEQLAPTVFASESACLVIRHDRHAGRLPPGRRLIYLVDDDLDAGASDESLPFLYRQRLRMVESAAARRIRRFAGIAVVSSPVLARVFQPMMQTHLLRPYWSEPFADLDHFAETETIDMAYLGAGSHREDLAFLLPVIRLLLRENPTLRFHLRAEHRLPGDLQSHARVCRIPGRTWTEYRTELSRRRFHLALYPLMDTPFNRGQSPNKLIEHAIVGAAPIYSENWREARRASVHSAGVCLPDQQGIWFETISALMADREEMQRLAVASQRLARTLNSSSKQRAFWRELLEIEAPVAAKRSQAPA